MLLLSKLCCLGPDRCGALFPLLSFAAFPRLLFSLCLSPHPPHLISTTTPSSSASVARITSPGTTARRLSCCDGRLHVETAKRWCCLASCTRTAAPCRLHGRRPVIYAMRLRRVLPRIGLSSSNPGVRRPTRHTRMPQRRRLMLHRLRLLFATLTPRSDPHTVDGHGTIVWTTSARRFFTSATSTR